MHIFASTLLFSLLSATSAWADPTTTGEHKYEITASSANGEKEKALHLAGLQACLALARTACEERHGRPRTATHRGQRQCQVETNGAKHCDVTCTVECTPPPPATKPSDLEVKPSGHESTID